MANTRKSAQLGMSFSTASNRLRKSILFMLVKKCGMDICYRCNQPIQSEAEMSIEHKKSWLGVSAELFWDLENIAFSHHSCNVKEAKRKGWVANLRPQWTTYTKDAPEGKKWCSGHEDYLTVDQFSFDQHQPSGYRVFCKECRRKKKI